MANIISHGTAIGAAQALVAYYNKIPNIQPHAHAVTVKLKGSVGDQEDYCITVAHTPGWTGPKVPIPTEYLGVPVKEVPWDNP